jgi:uncharacterized protein (UPF0335 family)
MEMGNNSAKAFLAMLHRFERLDEEMNETKEARKDLVQEAKAHGYDTKAMAKMLKERKEIRNKGLDRVREEKYMEEVYKKVLREAGEPLGYENEFGEEDNV